MKIFKRLLITILAYIMLVSIGIFAVKSIKKANAIENEITPYSIIDLSGTSWELNENILYNSSFNYSVNHKCYTTTEGVVFEGSTFYAEHILNSRPPFSFNCIRSDAFYDDNNIIYRFSNFFMVDVLYTQNLIASEQYMTNTANDSNYNFYLFNGIIEIVGGTDATNTNLISWLQSNATQVQTGPIQLTTPVLNYSSGLLSWGSDTNAEYFEIYLNDELLDTSINTNYNINSLGNYKIKAVGDGVSYSYSDFSNVISVTVTQLNTPVISLNVNVIEWLSVQNAAYYQIYLDNELIEDNYLNTSYEFIENGDYKVKAISNNFLYSNSNFSNVLTINFEYAEVVFYAKDNITELLHIENWVIGYSIYSFTNTFYSYQNLLTLIYTDYDINVASVQNLLIFNDNQLFENSYFNEDYIITNDVNIYYKIIVYDNSYTSNDFSVTSSNDSTLFSNIGDNLLSNYSLKTIYPDFDIVFSSSSGGLTSQVIIQSLDIINDFEIGNNFSIYTDFLGNSYYFNCVVSQTSNSTVYENYLYKFNIINTSFYLPLMDYDKFVVYSNNVYKFVGGLTGVTINYSNFPFGFVLNYNYGINYYYSNYFGFSFNVENYDTTNNNYICYYLFDTSNKFYILNYNYQYQITNLNNFKYVLINSSNFNNYKLRDISAVFNFKSLLVSNGLNSTFNSKNDCLVALENLTTYFSLNTPMLFYSDSAQGSEVSTGGIIPLDSNGLYKTGFEWYDVTAYLYNFFVYIIFDAPLISNFTKIIYIIVSFILWVFNEIILLFSEVSNNIFVVCIVGFLALKFILSLIFKRE